MTLTRKVFAASALALFVASPISSVFAESSSSMGDSGSSASSPAQSAQLDDATGVVVTTLSPGYAAAKAELQPGDVIHAINGKNFRDLEAFTKAYDDAVEKKLKAVLLQIQRGRGRQSVVLKITYGEE